jgi:hypothetical protein
LIDCINELKLELSLEVDFHIGGNYRTFHEGGIDRFSACLDRYPDMPAESASFNFSNSVAASSRLITSRPSLNNGSGAIR